MRHLVLAGTFDQARLFATENGWSLADWRHINARENIAGLEGPRRNPKSILKLHRVGTWFNRPDVVAVNQELAVMGFTE